MTGTDQIKEHPLDNADVRVLFDNIVAVDFPHNAPPVDSKGRPKIDELDEKLVFLPRNDIGNAKRLIARFGDDLIYIENFGWFCWTGSHWDGEMGERLAEKKCHETVDLMKREALALIALGPRQSDGYDPELKILKEKHTKYKKYINSCGNSGKLSAMRQEARPYLARAYDEMDTHILLVTVENGTLDLKGQEDEEGKVSIRMLPHNRGDYITKKMPVAYDPAAQCPKWLQALNEIVPDPEIQKFLQQWFGYCLTGSTREQKVMMMWGGGSNGKSVLMDTMAWIFGDYSRGIPIGSLMAKDKSFGGAGASPDLARLPGTRFVTASEPEAGQKFSENMLKAVSGEEELTVRHLNEGFFEYYPQFKLCISFNNKPSVRSSDDGFWRRVLLVPFEEKFYEPDDPAKPAGAKVKNKNLREELKAEGSGILNWMLDGYLMWREGGLHIPDKIRAAVAEYRSEANHLLQFFEAWCDFGPSGIISSKELYEAYALWAKDNSFEPYSKTGFGRKLGDDPRVKRERMRDTNYYKGIALNQDAKDALSERHRPRSGDDEGGDTVIHDIPMS